MWVQSLGQEDPLEKEVALHSSLAWRIPRTEEPSGLQSMEWTLGEDHSVHNCPQFLLSLVASFLTT